MFMVGMGLAIPICSEAVYRFNAFRITGLSLLIWSISTILCGFSFNFATIAICRMFVGIGEAAIISLAPPYIGRLAPFSFASLTVLSMTLVCQMIMRRLGREHCGCLAFLWQYLLDMPWVMDMEASLGGNWGGEPLSS